jgi:hypothetical protein
MNGLSDFIQDNWYELGSLIAQFAIVAMLFWYGRMWLRLRHAPEEQPEPSEAKPKTVKASAPSIPVSQRKPEPEPEPYEIPAYPAVRQQETERAARSYEFPASTRASLQEMEQTARRYEIPPAFAAPEPTAAGHGGVGRMLSPLPEAEVSQADPVRQPRGQRTGLLRAMIKWLREPMNAPRRVARPAA